LLTITLSVGLSHEFREVLMKAFAEPSSLERDCKLINALCNMSSCSQNWQLIKWIFHS